MERRLALLAELACDESCVATLGDPESYARLLVEMASVVDGTRGRLRSHALTMAAGSHVRQRVESILGEGWAFSAEDRAGPDGPGLALCEFRSVLGAGAVRSRLGSRLARSVRVAPAERPRATAIACAGPASFARDATAERDGRSEPK